MAIFVNFLTTSNHLHSLQVENCDSNSRLVVNEDGNGKFRPERVNRRLIHSNWEQNECLNITICTYLLSNQTNMRNVHPLEGVARGGETQLQVVENNLYNSTGKWLTG